MFPCRQFLLVGEKGYILYRKNLRLLDVQLSYDEEDDCLILQAPGMKSVLSVPLEIPEYDPSRVKTCM